MCVIVCATVMSKLRSPLVKWPVLTSGPVRNTCVLFLPLTELLKNHCVSSCNCLYISSALQCCHYRRDTFYFSHSVIRSLPVFSLMQLQWRLVFIPPTHFLYLSHKEQIPLYPSSSPFLALTVSPLSDNLHKWCRS